MKCIVLASIFLFSLMTYAELMPIDDDALGELSGQALFKIEENDSQAKPGEVSFTRLTMGLKIEINSTIDEVVLGRYHRNNGQDCTSGGRFCTNNNPTNTNFKKWNCTVSECGGIVSDGGKDPFAAGALVYGDLIGLSGGEKLAAALAGIIGSDYYAYGKSFNSNIFPSGFERTTDADIRLRDVTMGRVLGDNTLEDFIIEKPFVEFAYEGTGASRKIIGTRIGFGKATGTQGNAIDVISGFVQPVVTAKADIGLGSTAVFGFAPYLGGVRTPGYISPDNTKTKIVGGCSSAGLLGGVICDSVDTAEEIAKASPQAQLFPLQQLKMEGSPTFWLSFQSKDVTYNSETVGSQTFNYEEAKAGAWINIGALLPAGTNITHEQANFTGVVAQTTKPLHPDNYFTANPNSAKYPQSNNYY
jgi:hypothetical protein